MKLKAVTPLIPALLCSLLLCLGATSVSAQQVTLDKVAVIVDQSVILESEIEALVAQVKRNAIANNQNLPSDRALRVQAIERLIMINLQLEMAKRMGIQISDPQLDQTIANIAQQNGKTMDQLRQQIANDGLSYEEYREEVRREMVTGEVRRANVRRRIYITPQEVENLVKLMDEQGAQQAEFNLGHILIGFPPSPSDEEIETAKSNAQKVMNLLENGSDFAKLAIANSSGANALEGGDMGWLNINSMPTLFAEAVQGKGEGELIGPIRSGAGFHILKIQGLRGVEVVEIEEVKSRHILIKPSLILSEERAKEQLETFREQLLAEEADFAELAKEHSADPGSALRGGELGWAEPTVYAPEFSDTLSKLELNEISQPFRTMHGWHIVQLLERRVDDATEKRKEDKAYQLLFKRKFAEETDAWLREMRDSAYIEVIEPEDASAS